MRPNNQQLQYLFSKIVQEHPHQQCPINIIQSMIKMLALLLLIATIQCDNSISINCASCGNIVCFTIDGAAFDNDVFPGNASSCSSVGSFPTTYAFTCNSPNCSGDCQITQTNSSGSFHTCSSSQNGQNLQQSLNLIYSVLQNNPELDSTYNWCGCGLTTAAIVGIVIGAALGLILVIILLYCCIVVRGRKRRMRGIDDKLMGMPMASVQNDSVRAERGGEEAIDPASSLPKNNAL